MEAIHRNIKKSAMKKIMPFVAKRLDNIADNRFVAQKCFVAETRVSEARTGKQLAYNTLQRFLLGGIMKLSDILDKCNLNAEETKFVQQLILSDKKLQDTTTALLLRGFSVNEITDMLLEVAKRLDKGEAGK